MQNLFGMAVFKLALNFVNQISCALTIVDKQLFNSVEIGVKNAFCDIFV